MDGVRSPDDAADVSKPPRINLRPFDPCLATERLIDCWYALRRSSVDAAIFPEDSIFAFAGTCFFMATVHDLDVAENKNKKVEKIRSENVAPMPGEDRSSSRFGNGATLSGANFGATAEQPSWSEGGGLDSLLRNGQQGRESSPSSAHTGPSDYIVVTPNHQGNAPASVPTENALDNAYYNAYDQVESGMAGFTLSDDLSMMSNPEPVSSDLVGIAYLCQATRAAEVACEVSMGVALLPHTRKKGVGTATVRHLLWLAFEEFKFHRVSAGVIGPIVGRPSACDTPAFPGIFTEDALRMFVGIGFAIEGTRERAVPDMENSGTWLDVHYLAMLDTCWFRKRLGQPSGSGGLDNNGARAYSPLQNRLTRWDEMLARHQKEGEAVLRAEPRLKRSASTETLRPNVDTSTKRADVGTSLASSNISPSSAASECMTSNDKELVQQQGDRLPALLSANSSSSPPTSARSEFQPRSGPHCASEYENIHEGDDLLIEFDASTVHAKVARFLLAHPAPGPPPTELGSDLGSEVDSSSEFESCVDPDELDLLSDAKGKGKAKETIQQHQDQKDIQLFSSKEGDPFANSDLLKRYYDTLAVTAHTNPPALSGQVRKKQRLSVNLAGEAKNTTSPILLRATNSHLGTSTVTRPRETSLLSSSSSPSSSSLRLTTEFARQAMPTTPAPLPDENPNLYSDAHSDEESVLSEAETISTGMSTWDVLSNASDPHRSPSPTYSLSSGTSSLSLQNVGESIHD